MRRVKTGIVGLGRLGLLHARDLMFRIPQSELIAACSIVPEELQKVADWGIATFSSFSEMLNMPELEAVFIVSSSGEHAQHVMQALEAGKHVFCEKPLALTLEECLMVESACNAKPELRFQLGFMRRFDPSYAEAKRRIDAGEIGRPIMIKATSLDPIADIEGFLRFAPTSGGEFLDMAVHDIDLAHWFLDDDVETIYASGDAYLYPELRDYEDGDNVAALMRFKKGALAFLHSGRLAPNGYQVETEIVGTKKTLRIAAVPRRNLLETYDDNGVVIECVRNFPERFEQAFLLEKSSFLDCVIEGKTPLCGARDGVRTARTAFAATEAYRCGELVRL